MRIRVKTVGTLKTLEEGTRIETLEVPQESSVAQVIELLKIQDWEINLAKVQKLSQIQWGKMSQCNVKGLSFLVMTHAAFWGWHLLMQHQTVGDVT